GLFVLPAEQLGEPLAHRFRVRSFSFRAGHREFMILNAAPNSMEGLCACQICFRKSPKSSIEITTSLCKSDFLHGRPNRKSSARDPARRSSAEASTRGRFTGALQARIRDRAMSPRARANSRRDSARARDRFE